MVMAALSHSYSWPRDDTLLINDDELESFIAEEVLQPASQGDTTQDDSMGAVDPLDSTVSAPDLTDTQLTDFDDDIWVDFFDEESAVSAHDATSKNNPPKKRKAKRKTSRGSDKEARVRSDIAVRVITIEGPG